MKVWRIAKAGYARTISQMLSGDGAARFGGRWNPKGVPAVYCSENSSPAALEVLANLARPSTFPAHNIIDLDVPEEAIAVAELSTGDTLPQRTVASAPRHQRRTRGGARNGPVPDGHDGVAMTARSAEYECHPPRHFR